MSLDLVSTVLAGIPIGAALIYGGIRWVLSPFEKRLDTHVAEDQVIHATMSGSLLRLEDAAVRQNDKLDRLVERLIER